MSKPVYDVNDKYGKTKEPLIILILVLHSSRYGAQRVKITFEGLKSPTYNNLPTSKVEFGSFRPKFLSVLAHFRQLLSHNGLDIARSTTTGSGRLYGVGRIIPTCNVYAVIHILAFLFVAYFSRCVGSIDLKLPGAYV